jgi:hypothetical protein
MKSTYEVFIDKMCVDKTLVDEMAVDQMTRITD